MFYLIKQIKAYIWSKSCF